MANINNFRGILVYTDGAAAARAAEAPKLTHFALTNYNIKDFVLLDIVDNGVKTPSSTMVADFVAMAKEIYCTNSSARIWIGTPEYSSATTCTYDDVSAFLEDVRDAFKEDIEEIDGVKIGSVIWNNNIKGVYMNMESIYGTVDYTSASTLLNNTCIKLANDVSYYVHNTLDPTKNFDFLWIPYFGYNSNAATVIKNIGHVAARTTIFDLIVIQPTYYFPENKTDTDSALKANLEAIATSTTRNNVCYRDKTPVTTRQSYATSTIGFEMEIDFNVFSEKPEVYDDKNKRYNAYVTAFNSFKNSAVPICYYTGGLDAANNSKILAKIKEFYT